MPGVFMSVTASASAVGDATLAKVVRRQLYANLVTSENTDVILAHLSGDVRSNDVPILQLHTKHGVGQGEKERSCQCLRSGLPSAG